MRLALFLSFAFVFIPSLSATEAMAPRAVLARMTGAAVIREINLARQNPTFYAGLLEETRRSDSGNLCGVSDIFPLRTQERICAVGEAIRFLQGVKPLSPLVLSPGLCLAAADHCREQATGTIGHYGSNHTNPGSRISRYGAFGHGWAENIAYGLHSAREIVTALIVDAGVPGRGHRKNIFNRSYDVAGAAFGPHAKFGSVCSIDFASGYSERTSVPAENGRDKTL
jgi:uncharacterized protein YkwD